MPEPETSERRSGNANPLPSGSAVALSTESVLDGLNLILAGAPLTEILKSIVGLIEGHSEGMICSIFLVEKDGLHLRYAAAPNLPESYRIATDGATIGPNGGPCSLASYRRQAVFVADFQSDSRCENFKEKPLSAGLLAGWSSPIISHGGEVLGTFGMYFREVRTPTEREVRLIEYASRVAGIAIERDRSQAALQTAFEEIRRSERELRQMVDAIPQAIAVLTPDGAPLYANEHVLTYTGISLEEAQKASFLGVHPDDLERSQTSRKQGLELGAPFQLELRLRGKDGLHRWFLVHYRPLQDEQGQIIRWYATGTDIEDRKKAEESLLKENLALREEIDRSSTYEEIVGSSLPLRKVLSQVSKVAPTDSTVLILGETGTGKELIASAIHKRSKRSTKAFIRVNCAAIPPSLLASELFGHEKGAFTGAVQRRLGRFESADGGTIFLDEIGDLPLDTQAALLRVLQEREFERVGSSRPISVDVRVLAATNRDLESGVTAGTFREDLFYRLNVFPIQIPPLRERKDDISVLVEYLVERYAKKTGKRFGHIKKSTLALFQAYNWPGNIRELQNVVERAVILCEGETFSVDETWLQAKATQPAARVLPRPGMLEEVENEFAERERKIIESALEASRGRVAGENGAAERLGIPPQTLDSKIANLGIDKRRLKSANSKRRLS
jgi:formate hydrogenlyase transcriptional activator